MATLISTQFSFLIVQIDGRIQGAGMLKDAPNVSFSGHPGVVTRTIGCLGRVDTGMLRIS